MVGGADCRSAGAELSFHRARKAEGDWQGPSRAHRRAGREEGKGGGALVGTWQAGAVGGTWGRAFGEGLGVEEVEGVVHGRWSGRTGGADHAVLGVRLPWHLGLLVAGPGEEAQGIGLTRQRPSVC